MSKSKRKRDPKNPTRPPRPPRPAWDRAKAPLAGFLGPAIPLPRKRELLPGQGVLFDKQEEEEEEGDQQEETREQ